MIQEKCGLGADLTNVSFKPFQRHLKTKKYIFISLIPRSRVDIKGEIPPEWKDSHLLREQSVS